MLSDSLLLAASLMCGQEQSSKAPYWVDCLVPYTVASILERKMGAKWGLK